MSKVFITNFSNVDYSALEEKFGPPIVLTTGHFDLSSPQKIISFKKLVQPKIESASPEDFLVLSGAQLISSLCVLLWIKTHGNVRALAYNRRINGGEYSEVIISGAQFYFPSEVSQDNDSN